jgi:hypothetical protein
MTRLQKWWPVLVLALVPIIPLWRAIFLGEAIGPYDQIRQMSPWLGPPVGAWDVLQADGALQFAVWRDLVFEAWRNFELPLWNPYQLAGTPLLANSQSAGFYPPHIVFGILRIPTPMAMTLLAWMHLFWAGLGALYLTRQAGGERVGGTVAGAGFALSAFMIGWTALPSVIQTCAWIPWVIGLSIALMRGGGWRIAALLGGSIAMMLLAGHLQFAAYGLIGCAMIALWIGIASRARPLAAAQWALAVAIGACLAAPQVLPAVQFGEFSHRAGAPTEEGYAAYVRGAAPLYSVQGLAFPTALGDPTAASPVDPAVNAYWPALTQPGMNFAETAMGLGPLIFGLLFFSRRTSSAQYAVAALGILALLLAVGTPLNRILYFYAPGWSATGSPGRALVLFVLAGCVLAGLAVRSIPEWREEEKRRLALPLVALLAALALTFLPAIGSISYPNPYNVGPSLEAMIAEIVRQQSLPILVSLAIALLGLGIAAHRRDLAAPILVGATILAAAVPYAGHLVRTGRPLDALPDPGAQRIAAINSNWSLLAAVPTILPPNTASYSRIHDIGGYDSLLHRDTVNLLREINGQDPAPPANGNMMFVKPTADPALLAAAGVDQVWTLVPLPGWYEAEQVRPGWLRYHLPARPRASTPAGAARIVDEGFSHIRIQARGPGTLTLLDRNMPGWTATVGGREVPVQGELWREVELPDGEHEVLMRYRPPGLSTGLWLALAGLIAAMIMLAIGRPQIRTPGDALDGEPPSLT